MKLCIFEAYRFLEVIKLVGYGVEFVRTIRSAVMQNVKDCKFVDEMFDRYKEEFLRAETFELKEFMHDTTNERCIMWILKYPADFNWRDHIHSDNEDNKEL